jgi:RNA polymerase sigma-70 factor (ECF subfamily)
MSTPESTCWTVIRAAAAGSPQGREELAHRYLAVVRAYRAARWRGSPLRPDLDDAVQEVFVECFRQGGGARLSMARARRCGNETQRGHFTARRCLSP